MTPSLRSRKGFTLLELLVVISIIAVLIGLASVSFSNAQKKSRNAKRRGDLKAVQSGFEQYYAINGQYGATCDAMSIPTFLPNGFPTDPKNVDTSVYSASCSATEYCICAPLEAETGNSDTSNCTYTGTGTKSYFCVSNLQ